MSNLRHKSAPVKRTRYRVVMTDPDTMLTVADREFRTYRGAFKFMMRYTGNTRLGAVMFQRGRDGGDWIEREEPRCQMWGGVHREAERIRRFASRFPGLYRDAALRGVSARLSLTRGL
jgi:hypothetical protein